MGWWPWVAGFSLYAESPVLAHLTYLCLPRKLSRDLEQGLWQRPALALGTWMISVNFTHSNRGLP